MKKIKNKKWKYDTLLFEIDKVNQLTERLDIYYSDPSCNVITANIFKNGEHYSGLIISKTLIDIKEKKEK